MQELSWAPRLDLLDPCLYMHFFFFPRRFSGRRHSLQGDKGDGVGVLKLLAGKKPSRSWRVCWGGNGMEKLGRKSSCLLPALQFLMCPRDGGSCSLDGQSRGSSVPSRPG